MEKISIFKKQLIGLNSEYMLLVCYVAPKSIKLSDINKKSESSCYRFCFVSFKLSID